MTALWQDAVLLGAVLLLAVVLRSLLALRRDEAHGRLEYTDASEGARTLYAPRTGLVGRPDAVRTLRDGRPVPVEWKSRSAPAGGPPRSHRVQVTAYSQILEETTGRSPPFGLLRYSDGTEWEVPFDGPARRELGELLAAVRRPYDGRATPTPAKCHRCRWYRVCDARA